MHADKHAVKIEEIPGNVPVEQKRKPESKTLAVQCKFSANSVVQREASIGAAATLQGVNQTGMPNRLKSGLENLSGYDLSAVRVHYNSPKPRQLGALAYAQGTNIHLGAGQEKHLPHEAWHVVQQMQGRVRPTLQMKSGVNVNNDTGLEREADVLGTLALQVSSRGKPAEAGQQSPFVANRKESSFQFTDNRTAANAQLKREKMAGNSLQASQAGHLQAINDVSSRQKPPANATNSGHKLVGTDGSSTASTIQLMVGTDLGKGEIVYNEYGEQGVIQKSRNRTRDPQYLVKFTGRKKEWISNSRLSKWRPHLDSDSLYYFDDDDSEGMLDEYDESVLRDDEKAERIAIFKNFQNTKKVRYGKAPQESHHGQKGKSRRFLSRLKKSQTSDPMTRKKTYSKKGDAMAIHGHATEFLDKTIGNSKLTPIETAITAPVDAAMGTNRRAGRTPGKRAIIEQKVGDVFSALGSLIQIIPIAGAVGGPIAGVGTYLQEHAQGASKEQAMVKALAATGAGTLAGLIPGYGSYSGTVGLINDCRSLASNVELHGDPEYAAALVQRIEEFESIIVQMQEAGMDGWDQLVEEQIKKAYKRLAKEMRRREEQGRGLFGAKTPLLEDFKLYGHSSEDDHHDFG